MTKVLGTRIFGRRIYMNEELLSLKPMLKKECKAYGIDVTDLQVDALFAHLIGVLEKNKVINLTRVTEPYDAVILHILDSLLLCTCNVPYEGKLLDIGTGPGYPGVPICIAKNMEGTIIDARRKKIDADNEILESIGLSKQIHGVHGRIEEFALSHLGEYSIITARALAQTNIVIEYAAPLQAKNGYLLVAKANIQEDEFNAGLRASQLCGYEYVSRETYELPNSLGHREILVFKKTGKGKVKLPRKPGTAKSDPLGLQ